MSDKTVLVTGGAGYIGSHVVLALRDLGRRPVVIDNLVTGHAFAVPDGVPLIQGSVGDDALVRRVVAEHNVGAVMHFAASTVVPESVSDPLKYYTNNTANTTALWKACSEAGVKHAVFSSTAATYGEVGLEPVSERHATQPVSPYGWSKLMSEQVLRDIAATGAMQGVILRYFNVAGADPQLRSGQSTPKATHLIKIAAEVVVGLRDKLTVYGDTFDTPDGSGVRDYIHVTDLADAHIAALRHLEAGGSTLTLNCGYGTGISVKDVIGAVERVTGKPLPCEIGPARPGDPASVVADSSALKAQFGWKPRYDDIDLIVEHAIAWERRRLAQTASLS